MQKTDARDRRIFERIAVSLPLRFFDLRASKECLAKTCDISAEGIGLITEQALVPYSALEMRLHIPDKGEPLYCRGEAVWSRRIEPNKYRVGISLEKTDLMGISRILRLKRVAPELS